MSLLRRRMKPWTVAERLPGRSRWHCLRERAVRFCARRSHPRAGRVLFAFWLCRSLFSFGKAGSPPRRADLRRGFRNNLLCTRLVRRDCLRPRRRLLCRDRHQAGMEFGMKVVIVGAGAAGLAIGWRLRQAGVDVLILDRAQAGQGATWAAAGMIAAGTGNGRCADARRLNSRIFPAGCGLISRARSRMHPVSRSATARAAR